MSQLFCFLLFCGPLEPCVVAMYLVVCITLPGAAVEGSVCCWVCCRRSILVVMAALAEGAASFGGVKSEVLLNRGVKSQGNSPEKLQPRPVSGG